MAAKNVSRTLKKGVEHDIFDMIEREVEEKINETTVALAICEVAKSKTGQVRWDDLVRELSQMKGYSLQDLINEGKISEVELQHRLKHSTVEVETFDGKIVAVSHFKKYNYGTLEDLQEKITQQSTPESITALEGREVPPEVQELITSLYENNRIFVFDNRRSRSRNERAQFRLTPASTSASSSSSSTSTSTSALSTPSSSSSSVAVSGSSTPLTEGATKMQTIDFKNAKKLFFMGNCALKYDRVKNIRPTERKALREFRESLFSKQELSSLFGTIESDFEQAKRERRAKKK